MTIIIIILAILVLAVLLFVFKGKNIDSDKNYSQGSNNESEVKPANSSYDKIVSMFKKSEGDDVKIEELEDSYKVTVYHASSENFTGGVEQYRVDKKTFEASMIWHESPMRLK